MKLAKPQPLEPFSQEPPSLSVLSSLPVLARHSALSAAEGQNLRIPLDAKSLNTAGSRLQSIYRLIQSHI